ncbi:MAG: MFS transporter [Bowdeniella nasicola]|nr:MFS transporter [Bowdeniella nasicola]
MTSTPPPRLPEPQRRKAFAVILAAGFMTLLDVSIVNIALPAIEASLDASTTHIQLIVAGYSLSFGLMLVPAGRFGDVFGRRRVLIVGVALFVGASLACGLAPSADLLSAFRLLQGVGGALINPQVVGLIQQLYIGPERARAFGLFGASIGASTALGPVLGGVLIAGLGPEIGWRAIFLVNIPIGILLMVKARQHLPAHVKDPDGSLSLDAVGLILLGITVCALMLPFLGTQSGGLAAAPWWLLGIAAVGYAAFMAWELWLDGRGSSAILPRHLMRNTGFVFGTAVGTAYFAGFTGIWIVVSVYVQSGLGRSALVAGLVSLPFAITGGISSAQSGHLLPRYGRWLVVGGIAIMTVGIVAMDIATMVAPPAIMPWLLAVLMAFAGFGSGVVISPNQALTLADVPVREGGTAGGVLQTTQRVGASVGLAVMTSVFFTTQLSAGGDASASYGYAFSVSLRVTVAMLLIALTVAFADAWRRRNAGSSS